MEFPSYTCVLICPHLTQRCNRQCDVNYQWVTQLNNSKTLLHLKEKESTHTCTRHSECPAFDSVHTETYYWKCLIWLRGVIDCSNQSFMLPSEVNQNSSQHLPWTLKTTGFSCSSVWCPHYFNDKEEMVSQNAAIVGRNDTQNQVRELGLECWHLLTLMWNPNWQNHSKLVIPDKPIQICPRPTLRLQRNLLPDTIQPLFQSLGLHQSCLHLQLQHQWRK